jgi:hypothetical protein
MPEPYEKVEQPLRTILLRNFLGGVVWGLGATIGVSLILAILGFFLSKINLVPIVGSFLSDVFHYILQNNHVITR